jgi:hypothetical protein
VATKVIGFMRKRGAVVLVISVISALLAAKVGGVHGGGGGIQPFGFWDGPA